jgi:hypothetical protein
MTDRGLVALGLILHDNICEREFIEPHHAPGHHGYRCDPEPILGDKALFLPDGLPDREPAVDFMFRQLAEAEAEIARLRAALVNFPTDSGREIAQAYLRTALAGEEECEWCRGMDVVYACGHCGRSDVPDHPPVSG